MGNHDFTTAFTVFVQIKNAPITVGHFVDSCWAFSTDILLHRSARPLVSLFNIDKQVCLLSFVALNTLKRNYKLYNGLKAETVNNCLTQCMAYALDTSLRFIKTLNLNYFYIGQILIITTNHNIGLMLWLVVIMYEDEIYYVHNTSFII